MDDFRGLTDEALAKLAKRGEIKAFEELFDRYKKAVFNFLCRMIGNRETAEEVTQEAFMKAYNSLDIFDIKRSFATWLYTIARNLAKNSLRDRKYFRDISLDAGTSSDEDSLKLIDVIADSRIGPGEIAESGELALEAQKILDAMPAKYREVITLCSEQGMTYEEAAKVLRCSIGTISLRLNEAKKIFIKKLGIQDGGRKSGDAR